MKSVSLCLSQIPEDNGNLGLPKSVFGVWDFLGHPDDSQPAWSLCEYSIACISSFLLVCSTEVSTQSTDSLAGLQIFPSRLVSVSKTQFSLLAILSWISKYSQTKSPRVLYVLFSEYYFSPDFRPLILLNFTCFLMLFKNWDFFSQPLKLCLLVESWSELSRLALIK